MDFTHIVGFADFMDITGFTDITDFADFTDSFADFTDITDLGGGAGHRSDHMDCCILYFFICFEYRYYFWFSGGC